MKKEIVVNIPIPAGESIYVTIIEAWIHAGSLHIVVEDSEYRIASGEFPSEVTEDNFTFRLLKSTIGKIKRVNPDVLIGKQIDVDVVHKCLIRVGDTPIGITAIIDDVICCETDKEHKKKYLHVVKPEEK